MLSFKEHLTEELDEAKDISRESLTNKKGDELKVINNKGKISLHYIPKRSKGGKTFTVKNIKMAAPIKKAFQDGKDIKSMFDIDGTTI